MRKLFITLLGFLFLSEGFSQVVQNPDGSETIYCENFHVTKPLRELAELYPVHDSIYKTRRERYLKKGSANTRRTPQKYMYTADTDAKLYGNDESIIQRTDGTRENGYRAPILNVEGQDATGFRPMDPTGAAGPTYYMQAINGATYRIINKSTGATVTSGSLGALWTPDVPNDGDPIIMYDRFADRWFVSQFGVSGNKIYIAISTTNDPTGSYYSYTFTSPSFPDYLKFGIWQDGYYMTSNQSPARIFAFERSAMLAGSGTAKAVSQTFTPPSPGGFYCPMPGDAEIGTLPPAGTPCPIFLYTDNGWGISGVGDAVRIYNATVNWAGAGSMTIALASTLSTTAFDGSYDPSWNDISQPTTSQKLDGIGGIVQFRAQWSNWTTYRSVVLSWPVKISATQRSIMWAELRQNVSTGTWSIYQQSIYAPDTKNRWLSGIAMDINGSIGLSYARCSSTAGDFMGLYYTGRVASDPLGTMSIAEQTAFAGTGYQTGANRVGDYAHTCMDIDGETFWHTGEYMETPSGSNAATTRIYSFKITPAGPVASVTITSSDADNTICSGTSVTFTATPTNGGSSPTYQWYVNGTPVGSGGTTYTTSTLTNGQVVSCVMTSNLSGVVGSPATSNSITMTVSNPPTTAAAGTDQTVCGLTATLAGNTATVGTGAWSKISGPGTCTFSASTSPTSNVTVSAAGTYVLQWTISNNPCTASTDQVTITFNTIPSPPTAGSNSPVCAGSTILLTASTVSGATYSWTGPSGFTSSLEDPSRPSATAAMAGTYNVTVTVGGCTSTQASTTVTITTPVTPAVSIAITTGSNPSCTSSPVTFTATPTNGGTTPTYQWFVNGTPSGTGTTFSSSTLATSDVVTCTMTSGLTCVTAATANSNAITMTVNPVPSTPTISQVGASLVSSSTTGNQWYLDGVLIPGATSQTYTPTANGVYTVVVTSGGCSSTPSAGNTYTLSLSDINNVFGFNIYPNPNNGVFTIHFNSVSGEVYTFKLFNAAGQLVYSEDFNGNGSQIDKVIQVKDLQTGNYMLKLVSGNSEVTKKMIIH